MALVAKDVSAAAVTAGTTQTFAGATPLPADLNVVTVGTAADGILLPQVGPGMIVIAKNASANAGKVYVPNGGTLDGTAGATGVAGNLVASKTTVWGCTGVNAAGGSVFVTLFSA